MGGWFAGGNDSNRRWDRGQGYIVAKVISWPRVKRLGALGRAWGRLGAPGSAWERLGAPESAWERLGALRSAWERLGELGNAWEPLGALGSVRLILFNSG